MINCSAVLIYPGLCICIMFVFLHSSGNVVVANMWLYIFYMCFIIIVGICLIS